MVIVIHGYSASFIWPFAIMASLKLPRFGVFFNSFFPVKSKACRFDNNLKWRPRKLPVHNEFTKRQRAQNSKRMLIADFTCKSSYYLRKKFFMSNLDFNCHGDIQMTISRVNASKMLVYINSLHSVGLLIHLFWTMGEVCCGFKAGIPSSACLFTLFTQCAEDRDRHVGTICCH